MKQQKEQWKDINVNSLYQVSNFGNVRKVIGKDKEGKFYYKNIKTFESKVGSGVIRVCLRDIDGFGHYGNYSVATLVAEAFLKNQKPAGAIRAKTINGNRPHVDNIQWCSLKNTPKKNSRFIFIVGGKEVGIYNSLRDIAVYNRYSYETLKKILHREIWVKGVKVKRI